jgi:hypothetical protein
MHSFSVKFEPSFGDDIIHIGMPMSFQKFIFFLPDIILTAYLF